MTAVRIVWAACRPQTKLKGSQSMMTVLRMLAHRARCQGKREACATQAKVGGYSVASLLVALAAVFGACPLHAEYLILPREVVFSKASHKEIAPKCYLERADSAGYQIMLLDPEQEDAFILSDPARLTGASGFAKKHDVSSVGCLLVKNPRFRFALLINPSYGAEWLPTRDYALAYGFSLLGAITKTMTPEQVNNSLTGSIVKARMWGKEHPVFAYVVAPLGGEDKLGRREVTWPNGLIFRYSMFEVKYWAGDFPKGVGAVLMLTLQNDTSEKADYSVQVQHPGRWGTDTQDCTLAPGQKRSFAFYERRCDPNATGKITIKRKREWKSDPILFECEASWNQLGYHGIEAGEGITVSIDTYKVK